MRINRSIMHSLRCAYQSLYCAFFEVCVWIALSCILWGVRINRSIMHYLRCAYESLYHAFFEVCVWIAISCILWGVRMNRSIYSLYNEKQDDMTIITIIMTLYRGNILTKHNYGIWPWNKQNIINNMYT